MDKSSNKSSSENNFDVVVVGAGPAGLNVSQLLGGYGLRVCLLESKEDILNVPFHTLGSFIDLDKFGLTRKVVAADLTECIFHSGHVSFKKSGKAYIINKGELHRELLDKVIKNNVIIKNPVHISEVNIDGGG